MTINEKLRVYFSHKTRSILMYRAESQSAVWFTLRKGKITVFPFSLQSALKLIASKTDRIHPDSALNALLQRTWGQIRPCMETHHSSTSEDLKSGLTNYSLWFHTPEILYGSLGGIQGITLEGRHIRNACTSLWLTFSTSKLHKKQNQVP